MSEQTISLTQVWLGLEPYVLIRLQPASDGSGDPTLFVEAGGGAEDDPLNVAALVLTEYPAKGNPVAEMLRTLWSNSEPGTRAGIEAVTRQFNDGWLPFVRGEAAS